MTKTCKRALCWLLVYTTLAGALPHAGAARAVEHGDAAGTDYAADASGKTSGSTAAGSEDAPADEDEASVDEEEASFHQDEASAAGEQTGLRFRLSEGAGQPESRAETARPVPTTRLTEAETERVLRLLPPLKTPTADAQQFNARETSLPPPRAGRTIATAFPAPPTPDATPGPTRADVPEVVRVAPEGEVALAPQLSVSFSQPMVAVTSLEDLAAQQIPIELKPQPPGRWRWVGTRTLLFVPEGRFPMATRYAVGVRPGATAADGRRVAAAKGWSFSTPPPRLVDSYPGGDSTPRAPVVFLAFDQRVEPSAVLRHVSVSAAGRVYRARLATPAEVEADAEVSRRAKASGEGRWLALRVGGEEGAALPAGAKVTVGVGLGAPSAEGPLTTLKAQSFSFTTYGALRVTEHECGYAARCTPGDEWRITFSNALDQKSFKRSQVRVEPNDADVSASVHGNTLTLTGANKPRTSYRVTLDRSLRDAFGQTLGRDLTLAFNVGADDALLHGPQGLVVQDPSSAPSYSVFTVNVPTLRVSLYRVAPEDWPRHVHYMRAVGNDAHKPLVAPPGVPVVSRTLTVARAPDDTVETAIDLRPALNASGRGHVFVVVEALGFVKGAAPAPVRAWVQLTDIGLDAFVDRAELLGWATSLRTGAPLAGVELSIRPTSASATSGADGLARLQLPDEAGTEPRLLVARRGDDTAVLPEQSYWWGARTSWFRRAPADALRWFVFDDRKIYRPGEEVRVKGWLRRFGGGKLSDLAAPGAAATSVGYTLRDARANQIATGVMPLNAFGGFDTTLKLPPTLNLGHASLELHAQNRSGAAEASAQKFVHQLQVLEFRRPEFLVSLTTDAGPHFVKGHADLMAAALYYAGGGLGSAPVRWSVRASRGSFTPPNRASFIFGEWTPWWRPSLVSNADQSQTLDGRTDAEGKHRLRVDFDSVSPARPSNVTLSASVQDVNRQTWAATRTLLVHPSELYVGLRSERSFVQQGEPLEVQLVVTDLEGRAVAGRDVRLRSYLLEWTYEDSRWREKETPVEDCSARSAAEPVTCTFRPKEGGAYRVRATVLDDRERPNESELRMWVAGGRALPNRGVEGESVELIPDRREYRAGETAELLVRAPFSPAEGVLTLRRAGIVRTERFRMEGATHTLRVPLEEAFVPNVSVQVDVVGAAARDDEDGRPDATLPTRPAYASGSLNLPVPPHSRKLSVTAEPRDKALEPGATTVVDVEVRDASGRPVAGGETAVFVVDEAVLSLTGYALPDPLAAFYTNIGAEVADYHTRASVTLGRLPSEFKPSRDPHGFSFQFFIGDKGDRIHVVTGGAGGGGGGGAGGAPTGLYTYSNTNTSRRVARRRPNVSMRAGEPMSLAPEENAADDELVGIDGDEAAEDGSLRPRANFDALAVFAPSVRTDASGRARVEVKLPDSLTRYRVMAVASAGEKQFGSGESSLTARLPLMVRPSAPRFLNFGDRLELPVVLQNQTDAPMSVDLAVRASNAELTEGAGRRVVVPANDRAEVRFPVAAESAGTARFQFAALSGRHSDAAEVQLPVYTPATAEAFAAYGELDAGAIAQPVKAPSDAFRQFGALELTTSSTQLHELTDALLYLTAYPYECSEQLASRVMGVAALRDVLTAFGAKELPKPDELIAAVRRDVRRLETLQNDDGGFAFWRRGDKSWPYLSVHVAHALERARQKKFDVPSGVLEKSRAYLRSIERRIPSDYSVESRRAVVAYALYVRNLSGDRDAARAARLLAEAGGPSKLSLESLGWLLPVVSPGDGPANAQAEAIVRQLQNRATETASAAHFFDSYTDGAHVLLHSDRRADAVVLEALLTARPTNDLVPKLVRGLLAHRKQGRWSNTQENVFVLLALDRYFQTFERATPDFTARAWFGPALAAAHEFRGRSADRQSVQIPMSQLMRQTETRPQDFTISKEGTGRLYYRLGMRYAPTNLRLNAADHGFAVERAYEAVDDPSDVRREPDGTWRIKSGARVRVRLTLAAPARRYHVALTDPLPAGLESLNPALAVTEQAPADTQAEAQARNFRWQRTWFEHQNLRDERAEAFTSLLWEGVYNYSYVARATTPGLYVVPPAKAEEMYQPETFGRGQTDRVRVE